MSAGFLWIAASAGFLSLLTPCVFPMVPITIAYFGAPDAGHSTRRRALFFALGIVSAFTILGVLLSVMVGAAGLNRFASDPRVNLTLAALFLVFAANLFGWIEIRIPGSILNAANRAARSDTGTSIGAVLVGATFTITSLTCTAPFVGTLLVLAARGSWTMPLVGMIVFSAAFAVPFYLLALAPHALSRLPRAGQWMQTLRVLVGFLEVGAALKFVANADLVLGWGIFTRNAVLTGWSILAAAAALYFVRNAIAKKQEAPREWVRVLPAVSALAFAAWLASGTRGKALTGVEAFLPPAPTQPAAAGINASSDTWMLNDLQGALNVARTSNKFVFIDFTGYTCTNCRWMEANIFSRPDVSAELSRFVLARLYTDGDGEIYERQQAYQEKTFGTVALPLYAVVDGSGQVKATFSGLTRNPAEFLSFLDRADAERVAAR